MNHFDKLRTVKLLTFIILSITITQLANGCPTWIGRVDLASPAFFSDELYQLDPEDNINDYNVGYTEDKELQEHTNNDD